MTPFSRALVRAANAAEDALDRLSHGYHARTGWKIPIRVLPYRGYGTPERFCVRARVVRDRFLPATHERRPPAETLWLSLKRYATHEIAGARVAVRAGGETRHATSDREGFIEFWWEGEAKGSASTLGEGWLDVELELVDPPSRTGAYRAKAEVLTVPAEAEFGVITDIDDTIVQMGARHPLRKARALFLQSPHERLPFEGAAAFYAALRKGSSGHANNPVFYVSSSPWNLYEHLVEFFRIHDVPEGPLFLRDWGVTEKGFAPDGTHGHKAEPIERLLSTFPSTPFLLVGDSGQQDAEIYESIVQAHPGRILGVVIRDVTLSPLREAELQAIAARVRDMGVPFLLARDTVEAAEDAAARGWIRREDIGDVEAGKREDEALSGPVERLLETLEEKANPDGG